MPIRAPAGTTRELKALFDFAEVDHPGLLTESMVLTWVLQGNLIRLRSFAEADRESFMDMADDEATFSYMKFRLTREDAEKQTRDARDSRSGEPGVRAGSRKVRAHEPGSREAGPYLEGRASSPPLYDD